MSRAWKQALFERTRVPQPEMLDWLAQDAEDGLTVRQALTKTAPLSALDETRSRYRALHGRHCQLQAQHHRLQNRWTNLLIWYETADRSPQSWAELDKIMENQDD
jgi:hypothetical protein